MSYLLDMHTHTLASGHAYGSIRESVEAAQNQGLEILGITEHGKGIPGTCNEIYFRNMSVVPRDWNGLRLMLGCEMNIVDYKGTLSEKEHIIKKCFDIRLAGIHDLCYKVGSADENTSAYVNAIYNPLVDIITHPDDGRIPVHYEPIVKAAKETGTMLEINNSSFSPENSRVNPRENYIKMLKLCKEYEVMIIAGSDAHDPSAVGKFDQVAQILKEMSFPMELVANRSTHVFLKQLKEIRGE
ncbi:MAG: phosphatase [Anaerostipes sp.]|nr:phosphatase [Anaerostipes sp.]